MSYEYMEVIKNLYGMEKTKEDEQAELARQMKVDEIILQMGDKYRLAKSVDKKTEVKEESREWMI